MAEYVADESIGDADINYDIPYFVVKQIMGEYRSIDDEPVFHPTYTLPLKETNLPNRALALIPDGYYTEVRAGHVIFDNIPAPEWGKELIRYEIDVVGMETWGQDGDACHNLIKFYNER